MHVVGKGAPASFIMFSLNFTQAKTILKICYHPLLLLLLHLRTFFCTWVYSIILNAVFSLTIIWTSRDAFQNWNLVSVARILYNTEINLPLDLKCSITYHQKHWWIETWSSHSLSLPAVTQHNDTKLYQIIWMLENNVMNMIQTVQSTFHATRTINIPCKSISNIL